MEQSAVSGPARAGGEFFVDPKHPTRRRYEALRAYLHDGLTAAQVAEQFGYSLATVRTLVRDFRAGRTEFFIEPRPGPKTAPAKEAARDRTGSSSCAATVSCRSTRSPACSNVKVCG